MNGVDISSWQAGINPAAIDADFVIIKATQGTTYVNPFLHDWAEAVLSSGKLLGFYHYAAGYDVFAEARFFLEMVKPYIGRALLCLDWEEGDNASWFSHNQWTEPWLRYVKEQTGCTPVLYVQQSAMGVNDTGYPLWVAQYLYKDMGNQGYHEPECPYECAIRQYASDGRVSGYGGDLDMDYAFIDRRTWLLWSGVETEEIIMTCILWNNGTAYLLDAGKFRALRDENQYNVVKAAYKVANGKNIPEAECDDNWVRTLSEVYA